MNLKTISIISLILSIIIIIVQIKIQTLASSEKKFLIKL
jgi:hypothetical protein